MFFLYILLLMLSLNKSIYIEIEIFVMSSSVTCGPHLYSEGHYLSDAYYC